jgi:hypothetical protein
MAVLNLRERLVQLTISAHGARGLLVALALASAVALLAAGPSAVPVAADEYRLKAGFLFHFAQLVDWPDTLPPGPSAALTICTLGGDAFQGDLEGVVAGKLIAGRAIRVNHLKTPEEIGGCQLLFVGGAERTRVPVLVSKLKDTPVLTVGESDDFTDGGGMIRFVVEDKKVRFDVNLGAAQRAHLKISSRLLLLARNVQGGRK